MNFIIFLGLLEFAIIGLALVFFSCTICVQLWKVFRGNVLFHYLSLSIFICFFLFVFVFCFCYFVAYLICNLFIDFMSTNDVFLCIVVFDANWIGVCRLKCRFE